MSLHRALLVLRTVRHLRASQIAYWPLRRAQRMFGYPQPKYQGSPSAARAGAIAECVVAWGSIDAHDRHSRAEAVCEGSFEFLNRRELLGRPDWNRRCVSDLWTYHLHYFDFAIDLAWAGRLTGDARFAGRFTDLVTDWMESTRPGRGIGWDPYVISARVPNWIYALALFDGGLESAFRQRVYDSIGSQVSVLARQLEFHLRANHLQRNYRALLIAGLALEGAQPASWRARGASGLWRELMEQVLPDGGHFERSPMYHAIALSDFLECADLSRACGVPVPPEAQSRIATMVAACGVLMRDNGDLHLFNDAANGVAPPRRRLQAMSMRVVGLPIPDINGSRELPVSGYFAFVDRRAGERIIVDCGPPGPAHQPGHAHCDLLSFELDLDERPVVVDSGTSGYAQDSLRSYQRSTQAHNTVEIGGRQQSEFWGVFRMARRATVVSARAARSGPSWLFEGSYRPYADARVRHERRVERTAPGAWRITDRVLAATGESLRSFVHFHPAFALQRDGGTIRARSEPGIEIEVQPFGCTRMDLVSGQEDPVQGWYSPEFGVRMPAWTLILTVDANDGRSFGYELRRRQRL